ncbi:MAG: flagellar filament capping protein FliD [Syntrophaceae bacterium]
MTTSTNFISGLSSGIDWSTMVDQLIAVDQKSVTLVSNQQSDYQSKLTEWQSFNTKLLALKTAADSLKNPEAFGVYSASMTTDSSTVKGSDLMSVTASSTASIGSYQITINKLATAEKIRSVTYTDSSAALGSSYAGDILINGKTISIDATDSLVTLQNKINAANTGTSPTGVTASIIKYGAGDYRLTLTSDTTGAAGIGLDASAYVLSQLKSTVVVDGENASITVDGEDISQSSNTVDDVITGVSIDLLKADTNTTVTLNINRDIDAIKTKINDFVSAYNTVSSYINTQNSYDTTTKKAGGVLFGDGTLYSIKSDLTSIITQPVWGVNSQFSIMGLVGINLDSKGQLSVNDTTLTEYLQTNFNDILSLFATQGTTSSSSLSYVGDTRKSQAGEYTVHITTAATQSTSAASDNTSISGSGTLTVAAGTSSASINLTNGMSMTQVIDAINTELATVYTQKLVGSAQLQTGGVSITSETTWNNIDGTTLQNGDVINFSGTSRSGTSITGSYTINTVGTDTVQGLLTSIENAFSNNVTASIDTSGRITVTDKDSGTSQITLDITEPTGSGLDFGTVDKENAGGVTGRYALDITASNDGSDHLILKYNSYGNNSFTVSDPNNLLWNSSNPTVNLGTDVAGTINGEAATGSGQILTGITGNSNTEGLSVSYTGTSNNVDVGTVKLTIGLADLFDRSLFGITDEYEGYVSFKETSIQNNIDDLQTRIDQMNARLELKREQMISQFVKMEAALSSIQSQSSWLTSQITAAENGWSSL